MLIQSTHKNEKIVLGLLSYTEEGASMDELRQLLEDYRDNEQRDLLLYKEDENENFIGLIGVEHSATSEAVETLLLERISLIPSFRNEGVGYQIYTELRQRYPHAKLIGSFSTSELLIKWAQKFSREQSEEE